MFFPAVPTGPGKFARTDTATEFSYRVSAGLLISSHRARLGILESVGTSATASLMFQTFDHTADLGLRVSASSLCELFAEAAVGLTSLIVADVAEVESSQQRSLEVSSPDLEYLYFDWLSELLYLFESDGWLAAHASVEISGNSLRGVLQGETFCETRHRRSHEVKAITYHGLTVLPHDRDGGQIWTAEVIVDI